MLFTPRADDTYDVRATDATGRTVQGEFTVPLQAEELDKPSCASPDGHEGRAAPGRTRSARRRRQRGTADRSTPSGWVARSPRPCSAVRRRRLPAGDGPSRGRRARHAHDAVPRRRAGTAQRAVGVPVPAAAVPGQPAANADRAPAGDGLDVPATGDRRRGPDPRRRRRPRDLAPLDVVGERERISQALATVVAAGQVELDWLEPASPKSLRLAFRDGNYHVIHYVGHSDFTADGRG